MNTYQLDCDLEDLFGDLLEYLEYHMDVNDGEDGRPVANRAMRLHNRVEEALITLQDGA